APDVSEAELAALRGSGVIGVRIDLIGDGSEVMRRASMPRLLAQARELGWQVHVQYEKNQLVEAARILRAARAPLVFDHCGRPAPHDGLDQPGFRALLAMGRDGHAVKLSGPFRYSQEPAPYAD